MVVQYEHDDVFVAHPMHSKPGGFVVAWAVDRPAAIQGTMNQPAAVLVFRFPRTLARAGLSLIGAPRFELGTSSPPD
jgi:hypothetical protein